MSSVRHGVVENIHVDEDAFVQMVKDSGFNSLNQYAISIGLSRANLCDRLKGRYMVSVPMMYVMANGLKRPIDDMVKVFYPDLWELNQRLIKENKDV